MAKEPFHEKNNMIYHISDATVKNIYELYCAQATTHAIYFSKSMGLLDAGRPAVKPRVPDRATVGRERDHTSRTELGTGS